MSVHTASIDATYHANSWQGVGNYFTKRHGGRFDPEVRLYLTYLSSALMAVSLLVLGFALQNIWQYMIIAVFYGLQVVGISECKLCNSTAWSPG